MSMYRFKCTAAWRIAALLGALNAGVPARAQDAGPASQPAPAASSAVARPRVDPLPPLPHRDVRSRSGGDFASTLAVIELPPDSILPTARRHHALSIPLESVRGMVRQFGVDASDCALQLRMPTRFARDPAGGSRAGVDIQAQVRLACHL